MRLPSRPIRLLKPAGFTALEAAVMLLLLTIFSMVSIAVWKKGLPTPHAAPDEWKAKGGDAAVIKARTAAPDGQPQLNRMPQLPEPGPKAPAPTPGLDGEAVR